MKVCNTILGLLLVAILAISPSPIFAQSATKKEKKKKRHKTEKTQATTTAEAQLTQGTIKYMVTDVKMSDSNPQAAMVVNMMKGSTNVLHFKPEQSHTDMNMMGGMTRVQMFMQHDSDASTMYLDAPVQGIKYKIAMTKENKDAAGKATPVYEYTADKSKTKEIAGYACYLVKGRDEDDNTIELYVTDKIKANNNNPQFKGLQGFPMEFVAKQGPMEMTLTAQSVSGELPEGAFTQPTEGYENKTFDDLKKMRGGF
jgi:hypothetical protein